ncbi:hypothetical protein [Frankia sp. EAN1pec]|uniref:hypothetical protein n=1 Tax=Parafrankia sp. (strain EAN1pec) TaxID=298653 RepID=UPI0003026327
MRIQDEDLLDGECTAGYLTTKSDGETYLLTAGHCFPEGAFVSVPNANILTGNPSNTIIGIVVDRRSGFNTYGDYESIRITSPGLATNQIIAADGLLRNVTDDADDFVANTSVCFNGKTSDEERCARNDAMGDEIFDDHVTYHVAAAFQSDVATKWWAQGGDSGSGVYRWIEDDDEFRVYGIIGGPIWHFDDDDILENPTDGGFWYSFDQDIQGAIGTSVLTDPV